MKHIRPDILLLVDYYFEVPLILTIITSLMSDLDPAC